jgi:hypothetical protein
MLYTVKPVASIIKKKLSRNLSKLGPRKSSLIAHKMMINNCNQEHKTAFWLRRNKVLHTEIMDHDYDNVMPWKDILYKYDAYILFRAE